MTHLYDKHNTFEFTVGFVPFAICGMNHKFVEILLLFSVKRFEMH